MRIGIDARPLGRNRAGIGNYIHELVRLLPEVASEHDFFLYSNKEMEIGLPGTAVRKVSDPRFRRWPGTFWLLCRGGMFVRRNQLDVFWSTGSIVPLGMPTGVLKIVTVYDLVWLFFPEMVSRYNLFVHRLVARDAIQRSDLVIAISQSTADDLVRVLGVPAKKIRVVYPSISQAYKPHDSAHAAQHISTKYQVPSRYMAAVGTVEPRKNLKLLVEVLRILKRTGQLDCPLLLAGGSGWKSSNLFREIRAAGLTEKEIRFLGYLPDEDLPYFYAGAQVFLFPSLYEGFGLPPVEAMACGTPVIASDAKSMSEVLGDAAILRPPTDAEGFAVAVRRVLSDEDLRRSLRLAGLQRAQKFGSEMSVKQLMATFTSRERTPTTEDGCVEVLAAPTSRVITGVERTEL